MVSSAAPWMTWIRRNWLKFSSNAPKTSALTSMPSRSMT